MLASPSDEIQRVCLLQKESPSDVQLHLAAIQGDVQLLRRVLDSGKVHVDSKDMVRAYWITGRCRWTVTTGREQVSRLQSDAQVTYSTPHTRVKHSVELGPSYPVVSPLTSPNCVSVALLKTYLSRVIIFRTVKYSRLT